MPANPLERHQKVTWIQYWAERDLNLIDAIVYENWVAEVWSTCE
jgi:hypothetical protein